MNEDTPHSADRELVGAGLNGAGRERVAAPADECTHCNGGCTPQAPTFGDTCVNCGRYIIPPGYALFHVSIVIGSLHTGSYGEASLRVVARDEEEAERIARERTEAHGLPMSGDGIDESGIRVYVTPDDSSPRTGASL